MNLDEQITEVEGKRCHIYGDTKADVCILCGMGNHNPNEISDTARKFYDAESAENCRLVIFETADWNRDFSPWPVDAQFGDATFAGKAPETLSWLTDCLLPYLESKNIIHLDCKKYIAGYSLSGLFALWAFLETDVFAGAASCSGSLWYPDWIVYLKTHRREHDGIVYLSLGSKEERTKNALLSAVGNNTRESNSLFRQDTHITKTTLEWNKGGHFTNPTGRLVKGMHWLMEHGNMKRDRLK